MLTITCLNISTNRRLLHVDAYTSTMRAVENDITIMTGYEDIIVVNAQTDSQGGVLNNNVWSKPHKYSSYMYHQKNHPCKLSRLTSRQRDIWPSISLNFIHIVQTVNPGRRWQGVPTMVQPWLTYMYRYIQHHKISVRHKVNKQVQGWMCSPLTQ